MKTVYLYNFSETFGIKYSELGVVVYIYNPSYSEGRGRSLISLRPDTAKVAEISNFKNKKGLRHSSGSRTLTSMHKVLGSIPSTAGKKGGRVFFSVFRREGAWVNCLTWAWHRVRT
jgi:hypothetical protein